MTAEDVLDKLEEYITGTQSGDVEGDILSWVKEQRKSVYEKRLWHKPTDKPRHSSRVVVVYGLIKDSFDFDYTKKSLDMLMSCNKWAYFEELIEDE